MNTFLIALIIIFAGGTIPLLINRRFQVVKTFHVFATFIGCILGIYALFEARSDFSSLSWSWKWLHAFTLDFSFDSVTVLFILPILVICPLAALYSYHYLDRREDALKTAASLFFLNLLIVSMILVTTAHNLLAFIFTWEIMSLSSYFLVMYDSSKEITRKAGYMYLVFSQAGALFIIASIAVIFSYTGDFSFNLISSIPEHIKLIAFFLALAGFGSKAGIFPVHIWLPHAHPAAPSHISAVMSGVMIKMGIYGIFRMYMLLDTHHILIGQIVLVLGMFSGVLGVLYALGKHNIKKLLAYHSVENIGIIMIGAGLGMLGISLHNPVMASFGFAGSILHVLNHSIFKSLLFLCAGAVIKMTGISHIDELGGVIKWMPLTGRTFITGSISISGLPPFNGFISEFLIYFAAFNGLISTRENLVLIILAIVSLAVIGGLASACFTKVIGIVFLGEPRTPSISKASEAAPTMTIPMVILALACILIGVFPKPFIYLAFSGLADIHPITTIDMGLVGKIADNLAFAARLFLVTLCVVTLARKLLYRKKEITAGPTWGCGFTRPNTRMQYTGTSYAMSIVSFFKPFALVRTAYSGISRIFPESAVYDSRVDDVAETALHRYLTAPLYKGLGKLRWIQHGNIQLYIGYIILTIVVLLVLLFFEK